MHTLMLGLVEESPNQDEPYPNRATGHAEELPLMHVPFVHGRLPVNTRRDRNLNHSSPAELIMIKRPHAHAHPPLPRQSAPSRDLEINTSRKPPPTHPTSSPPKPKAAAMSFFRITLRRSSIGLPQHTRNVLQALGLRRRMQTVFHPVEPQFAGMILKVKELVSVEEVSARQDVKAERTPERGFYVERAVARM